MAASGARAEDPAALKTQVQETAGLEESQRSGLLASLFITAACVNWLIRHPDGRAIGYARSLLVSLLYLVIGTVLGALFLGVIKNALPVIGISPFAQMAISGIVIVLAVVFNARAERKKGRIILRDRTAGKEATA